ncbi:hypothetical protein Syun_009224 [Stephania yunnanensis]|uniref:Uncharacterized protein n=1 Tax=Stephania yunnanensis TaxID=152371 RepID=A0AAP0KGR3_9MAGN
MEDRDFLLPHYLWDYEELFEFSSEGDGGCGAVGEECGLPNCPHFVSNLGVVLPYTRGGDEVRILDWGQSGCCLWWSPDGPSGSFFLPVSVNAGAVDASPSLNDAMPYIVKQMLNMVTRPAAPRDPAAPAIGVFLRGHVITKSSTSRGLEVIGVSKLPMNGSPLIGWITWNELFNSRF